ncbi:uncharacterized protein [Mytilus edulis]|uniref:uncharacterized protein n=1 Tax=Mytilus edulis TaxID=6550 RepID=UPI0039EE7E40
MPLFNRYFFEMNYHLPFPIVICSHHMQDINAIQPDDTTGYGTFFQHEIAVLITVAVLLVSVVITIYFWKQRYKRKRKKENMDMSQLTEAHVLLHQSAYKPVNIDRSQLSMTEYEDEADMCTSQTIQTDLQSLSSPKTSILTEIQRRRTHIGSFEVQPLPKDEDNLLHVAYTILYTVPRAIEDYIEREYKGGFLQAIRDYKDQLKAKLMSEEWDLLSQLIVHHRLYHFYDEIIHDTILDNEVLDLLISRSILRKEDREEIEHHPRQSDRNTCILDLLIQRPQDSYSVLLDVLKECPTCSKDLIDCMEDQTFSNHGVFSQSKVKSYSECLS